MLGSLCGFVNFWIITRLRFEPAVATLASSSLFAGVMYFVTHGYTAPFRHWLESQGYDAGIVETQFTGDDTEAVVEAAP